MSPDHFSKLSEEEKWNRKIGRVSFVVAVLCFLIPALFIVPASFRPAREGKNALGRCLANLKQIGLATYMYQQDNNGLYPSVGTNTTQPSDWIHWQSGRDLTKSALVPYTGNTFVKEMFLCPNDPQIRPANFFQYSYTANINIFTGGTSSPDATHTTLRYAQIKNASTKIILVEEEGATIDDAAWEPQKYTPTSKNNTLAVRHEKFRDTPGFDNSKSTAAFADGHAEYLERQTAMEPRTYDPFMN